MLFIMLFSFDNTVESHLVINLVSSRGRQLPACDVPPQAGESLFLKLQFIFILKQLFVNANLCLVFLFGLIFLHS